MRMEIDHLVTLNGRLYYRRRVPEHLRAYFGKREVKKSLKLKEDQKLRAIPLVAALDKQFDERRRVAERALKGAVDPHEIAAEAWEWALEEKFVGFDKAGLGDGGRYEYSPYEYHIDQVTEAAQRRIGIGREVELTDLSALDRAKIETVKKDARLKPEVTLKAAKQAYVEFNKQGKLGKAEEMGFKQFEEWLNVSDEFPQYKTEGFLNLRDVSRASVAKYLQFLSQSRGQSDDTIRRRLNSIKALWNFALLHFEMDGVSNPWSKAGAHLNTKVGSKKTKVLAFTNDHLKAIDQGLTLSSVDPELKLLIATMRCTGARPLEVGGLMASDVQTDREGGAWINIDYNDIREIKNKSSIRRVPIVDQNTALGLLELAARKGEGSLFQKGFHTTSNLSQRSNRFLRKGCGLPQSSRIVSYSFRHTMIEAFRVADVSMELGKAIVGHSEGSVTEGYGAGAVSLSRMREALEAAMGVLGEVDTYHYTPEELAVSELPA